MAVSRESFGIREIRASENEPFVRVEDEYGWTNPGTTRLALLARLGRPVFVFPSSNQL